MCVCLFCRPYVIDLESTNGTYVNNQRIESARYYELKEKVRDRERRKIEGRWEGGRRAWEEGVGWAMAIITKLLFFLL